MMDVDWNFKLNEGPVKDSLLINLRKCRLTVRIYLIENMQIRRKTSIEALEIFDGIIICAYTTKDCPQCFPDFSFNLTQPKETSNHLRPPCIQISIIPIHYIYAYTIYIIYTNSLPFLLIFLPNGRCGSLVRKDNLPFTRIPPPIIMVDDAISRKTK